MNREQLNEILYKQLELLAEDSKSLSGIELAKVTMAMVEVVKQLVNT